MKDVSIDATNTSKRIRIEAALYDK
jgi:hypothetical protein